MNVAGLMRRDQHVLHLPEGMNSGEGLHAEDIQSGGCDSSRAERGKECVIVHDGAPSHVDEVRAGSDGVESLCIHHANRLERQWRSDYDVVRKRQTLAELISAEDRPEAHAVDTSTTLATCSRHDFYVHAHRAKQHCDARTNPTGSDDNCTSAFEVRGRALVPNSTPLIFKRSTQVLDLAEDAGEHKLGNGLLEDSACVRDEDASRCDFRGCHGVDSDAVRLNPLQLPRAVIADE
nr:hypothetical protein [Pseudoclavibacter terrae]